MLIYLSIILQLFINYSHCSCGVFEAYQTLIRPSNSIYVYVISTDGKHCIIQMSNIVSFIYLDYTPANFAFIFGEDVHYIHSVYMYQMYVC